jgi:hypothetical protein
MPAHAKPPGQRRRRNLNQTQWRTLPREGRKGRAPGLPDGDWLPSTLVWWREIWASPMATAWTAADRGGLERLATLKDEWDRGGAPVSMLIAIQRLEDRFGLSPEARKRLHWQIEPAEPAPSARRRPRARRPAARQRLRVVDASAGAQ